MATTTILFILLFPLHVSATQSNSAEASLYVNYNTAGDAPLQAIAGKNDINVLIIDGPHNASYLVKIGQYQEGVFQETRAITIFVQTRARNGTQED